MHGKYNDYICNLCEQHAQDLEVAKLLHETRSLNTSTGILCTFIIFQ